MNTHSGQAIADAQAARTSDVDWRALYARAITDPEELLRRLELPLSLLPGALAGNSLFRLRVPEPLLERMRPGDVADPLLRQVLPLEAEAMEAAGFDPDPVGDLQAMAVPGVLHKYSGRALIVTTGACAVNCRYCFRRSFPYSDAQTGGHRWQAALAYLRQDRSISEVILSGGDPLVLSDHKLAAMVRDLESITHINRLRIHSRLPVVLPQRVDDALLGWLRRSRLQRVVVLHANHANELDHNVELACRRLRDTGVTLLNQAVLLRGVNDDTDTLARLSERLFAIGVLPYYLHVLDRVQGAAHFLVEEPEAKRLLQELASMLPGYLVPRLAREDAGEPNKTLLLPATD